MRAFLAQFARPLPLLLLSLAALDLATGEGFGAAVIAAIVLLSAALGFVREYRADRAGERLRHMDMKRCGEGRTTALPSLRPAGYGLQAR